MTIEAIYTVYCNDCGAWEPRRIRRDMPGRWLRGRVGS